MDTRTVSRERGNLVAARVWLALRRLNEEGTYYNPSTWRSPRFAAGMAERSVVEAKLSGSLSKQRA